MLLHTFYLLLAYWYIVSMFKNRLELDKNLMQIMHITIKFVCASITSVHFKFGFDFLTFSCMSGVFIILCFFPR